MHKINYSPGLLEIIDKIMAKDKLVTREKSLSQQRQRTHSPILKPQTTLPGIIRSPNFFTLNSALLKGGSNSSATPMWNSRRVFFTDVTMFNTSDVQIKKPNPGIEFNPENRALPFPSSPVKPLQGPVSAKKFQIETASVQSITKFNNSINPEEKKLVNLSVISFKQTEIQEENKEDCATDTERMPMEIKEAEKAKKEVEPKIESAPMIDEDINLIRKIEQELNALDRPKRVRKVTERFSFGEKPEDHIVVCEDSEETSEDGMDEDSSNSYEGARGAQRLKFLKGNQSLAQMSDEQNKNNSIVNVMKLADQIMECVKKSRKESILRSKTSKEYKEGINKLELIGKENESDSSRIKKFKKGISRYKRKKNKLFACPMEDCPKMFFAGQALGGHMSRAHPNQSTDFKSKQEVRHRRTLDRVILKAAKKEYENETGTLDNLNRSRLKKIKDCIQKDTKLMKELRSLADEEMNHKLKKKKTGANSE